MAMIKEQPIPQSTQVWKKQLMNQILQFQQARATTVGQLLYTKVTNWKDFLFVRRKRIVFQKESVVMVQSEILVVSALTASLLLMSSVQLCYGQKGKTLFYYPAFE